jgi:nitric oxide reductase NorD protein
MQDVGELGDDYLKSDGGDAPYPGDEEGSGVPGLELDGDLTGSQLYLYPEWDYARQRFREAFCALTEQTVPDGDEAFVADTRQKYRGLAKSVQRVFEAILSEAQRQRRQPHGDELDLDALVDAHVDLVQGREVSDRLYTHFRKSGRSVAVMFMVDMSGSTKGWVNDAERESMVLLADAVETLGHAYAIYGFSGRTNKRCEIYRVKTFDEPCSAAVRRRISGMAPKAYTRMGVAIRHLGQMLAAVPARTKLLITLSDGKPEDYGSYRGRYGIEDTRHALLEAKRAGIHPFCITIDREAQSYLPHMYGSSNYTVVDDVRKLPYKVADIYRRLTT